MEQTSSANFTPLRSEIAFYTILSFLCVFGCLFFRITIAKIALYFCCGIILWTLIEYLFHRFIYHDLVNRSRSQSKIVTIWYNHNLHHQNPKNVEDVITQIPYSLPIAVMIALLLLAVTWDLGITLAILPGVFSGYLYYEWVHYHTHYQPNKILVSKWQTQNHLLHHFETPERRFGVTTSFWDILFRTR